MDENHYSRTIECVATIESAYAAVTSGIGLWWTQPDHPICVVGDCAKFTFPPGRSYWTFEARRLVSNKMVELECVDAQHLHEGMPDAIIREWLGTKVRFELEQGDGNCIVRMTHVGLIPSLLCYEICEAGWDYFLLESLRSYLDTGTGLPHGSSAGFRAGAGMRSSRSQAH